LGRDEWSGGSPKSQPYTNERDYLTID
jgi:hypothetical protein